MRALQVMITIVELDPVIAEIAKRWFHFREGKNQRCVIGDGVDFIREAAQNGAITSLNQCICA